MGDFGQDAGVTPYCFSKDILGFFNDHRESGPQFNVSSEERCFLTVPSLFWGARTYTWAQGEHPLLALLTPLPSASKFSQEVFHPGTYQAQPCLAFSGRPVLAYRVIWLPAKWHTRTFPSLKTSTTAIIIFDKLHFTAYFSHDELLASWHQVKSHVGPGQLIRRCCDHTVNWFMVPPTLV